MQINNLNGFKENLIQKYLDLEKNYLSLQNKIKEKNNMKLNYKTELCKKFQTKGYCPYGNKCQFAHGEKELIAKIKGENYKKEKCKSFYQKGYCPYGSRCQFQHDQRKFKDINISYFYLQLFLYKYYDFFNYNKNYFKNTTLYKKRLPIFESLSDICKSDKNNYMK